MSRCHRKIVAGVTISLNPLGLVDGACNRQFIISELHDCDRIYTVRALNTKWLDHPPQDYFDNEVFKEWLWINSAYTTEVAGMNTINDLIDQGALSRLITGKSS